MYEIGLIFLEFVDYLIYLIIWKIVCIYSDSLDRMFGKIWIEVFRKLNNWNKEGSVNFIEKNYIRKKN